MVDITIIPNENILNNNGVSIGDRVRLTETSPGYVPTSVNDNIIIKLTNDNREIAIGEILISAQNFQSTLLSIKTANDGEWKSYATLTSNKTYFDNLYATELQFQFTPNARYIKIGLIGCFPSNSKEISF